MNKKKIDISIIIVNWNGKKWLKNCLDSLYRQSYVNFEIILVDNGSRDESVIFVKKKFPKIIIIQNKENTGFAGGNNIGVKYAHGKYILLLNNDTWAERDYLKNFIKAYKEIPHLGSVQSKIVLLNKPDKLDACGSFWTDSAFLYHYGYGKDQSLYRYSKPMPFFSNKGASMLIPKETIDKIGLFDDDFWCYYEETDFCHRVWIAGYECWYYPKAVVHHAVGGTSIRFDNSEIQFHNFKNRLMSYLKNFEFKTLIFVLPAFLFFDSLLSFTWLIQGKPKHFFSFYKSIYWNIKNIKKTLVKRKKVQMFRKKSDREIFIKTKKNPRLSYYYYLFTGLQKYRD